METTTPTPQAGWHFDNSYAALPEIFRAELSPMPVQAPRLLLFNRTLALELGLRPEVLESDYGAAVFGGNQLPEGARPIAQAYAGHQFGHFAMLGDGRAILLGEQMTPDGKRYDIQLKGSGRTPFSRSGDGRAALGPMLREYIISEAMHALGIPTTRSLAVTLSGEAVYRETAIPGAILTRVAASHVRVGTFEYVAARREPESLRTLADYVIRRHYPDVADAENPYLALLRAVIDKQAELVASWLSVGFIHGVMNTDNMALSGETIDYGPCAFLDDYDSAKVFSSIDAQGRYAYGNQPNIAQWNLVRFAETLIPLLHAEEAQAITLAEEAIESFPRLFRRYWMPAMRAKMGLFNQEPDDVDLLKELLEWMEQQHADYTNTFRDLSRDELPDQPAYQEAAFAQWHQKWLERLARQPQPMEEIRRRMRQVNPAVIPRNHKVEEALTAAAQRGDLGPVQQLLEALARPFEELPGMEAYRLPPLPEEVVGQTFCGT